MVDISLPRAVGRGVPAGGLTGQVLVKTTGMDYDTQWATPEGGGSEGIQPPFPISYTTGLQEALNAKQPVDNGLTSLAGLTAPGLYYLSAPDVWSPVVIGANLTFTDGTLSASGGGGGGVSPPFAISDTTGLQAALDGKQPLDSDLTAIAALTTTSYGRGLLTLANVAALKTSLSLAKADVGLGNVDNTSDASKPVSTAQQTALDLKANLSDTIISVTTSRALATTDNGAVLEVNSASAVTLTVPATLPAGFNCLVRQVGSGQAVVAAGSGATVNTYTGASANTPGQWSSLSVSVRATAGAAVVEGAGATSGGGFTQQQADALYVPQVDRYTVVTGDYSLTGNDISRIIEVNSAAPVVITLPALSAGFSCLVRQVGAGQVSLAASGVTIRNRQSHIALAGQWAEASISYRTATEAVFSGDTA